MREFKDKHIGELPSQTAANLQILGGLQTQLQVQQDALSRAKQQNTYLESLLSQYRSLGPSSARPGEAVPGGLAAIDQELDRLKAQLTDLSSHYTDKHPDVRKTKEQIAKTERMREKFLADMNSSSTAAIRRQILASPRLRPCWKWRASSKPIAPKSQTTRHQFGTCRVKSPSTRAA